MKEKVCQVYFTYSLKNPVESLCNDLRKVTNFRKVLIFEEIVVNS